MPGPEPWAAIRTPPLSRAPPEEVGIVETMRMSSRKKMTNPDIFLEKDDFNGTSGNSRAYIPSFVHEQHTCQQVESRPAFLSTCIFKGMIPYRILCSRQVGIEIPNMNKKRLILGGRKNP